MRRGTVDENDLRAAMRASMTINPPPPMESAPVLSAGRRAVRRRATLAGAGVTATVLAVTAVAVNPGLQLVSGGDSDSSVAGAGAPSAIPTPSAGGEHTKPVWPLDGDGKPQQDATARSGERYEQGKKLLGQLLTAVPDGWTTPTGETLDRIPLRDHQAQVEGDQSGSTWGYLARAAVAKDAAAGQLLADVRTRGNGLPQEPCALAQRFVEQSGDCEVVTVGRSKVGVVRSAGDDSAPDQWAAYRHPDGVVVFVAQSRRATNGQNPFPPLKNLPLSVPQLAALATDDRFHLS